MFSIYGSREKRSCAFYFLSPGGSGCGRLSAVHTLALHQMIRKLSEYDSEALIYSKRPFGFTQKQVVSFKRSCVILDDKRIMNDVKWLWTCIRAVWKTFKYYSPMSNRSHSFYSSLTSTKVRVAYKKLCPGTGNKCWNSRLYRLDIQIQYFMMVKFLFCPSALLDNSISQ